MKRLKDGRHLRKFIEKRVPKSTRFFIYPDPREDMQQMIIAVDKPHSTSLVRTIESMAKDWFESNKGRFGRVGGKDSRMWHPYRRIVVKTEELDEHKANV